MKGSVKPATLKSPPKKANKTNAKSKTAAKSKTPIRDAVVKLTTAGIQETSKQLVARLAGLKLSSLGVYLPKEKKGGLLDSNGKNIWLTPSGRKATGIDDMPPPSSNKAAQTLIKEILNITGKKAEIVDFLSDGVARTREQVMAGIGCTNAGSFGTYVSSLRPLGILEDVENPSDKNNKYIRLTDMCFPLGRPAGLSSVSIRTS